MRHHGWELPYHPLQVVAIAVFISLAFAFYVFFIPFLGSKVLQYHIIALFSPLVILVFALYIRCAAANPADPGVGKPIKEYTKCSSKKSAATSDSKTRSANRGKNVNEQDTEIPVPCWKKVLGLVCSCFFSDTSKNTRCQEDLLYCSLCEAEIFKFSKHCRACDKCVEGFDHHCRWINNCIGKKNYKTFVALMVTSLLLLLLEWGIGVFVIVRCLLDRKEFEDDISSKLGSSFSLVPFIVVVGLCTLLAMLATFPLGQLFFFHMILIHKGLSTYDYIVAMRERDQLQGDDQSSQSSPVSSVATAASGLSSHGVLQRRPWCTPPRLLVEQQDTVVKGPSLADVEQGKAASKKEEPAKRKAVKINPWKLARMSAEDASKASERARENSSVLKPVANEQSIVVTETDNSSPEERLRRSTASEIVPVARKTKRKRDLSSPSTVSTKERSASTVRPPTTKCVRERKHHEPANGHVKKPDKDTESIAPLQLEARSAFWPRPPKSLVPSMALLSPDDRPGGNELRQSSPQPSSSSTKPWLQRSVSDGYEASGGESADDSEHGRRLAHAWSRLKQSSTFMSRDSLRTGSSSVLPPPVPLPVNHRLRVAANVVYNSVSVQRFPPSTDESNSSPSRYNSPDRDSDFFSAEAAMIAAPRQRNEYS